MAKIAKRLGGFYCPADSESTFEQRDSPLDSSCGTLFILKQTAVHGVDTRDTADLKAWYDKFKAERYGVSEIVLVAAMSCPAPAIHNKTSTWVEPDRQAYARAQKRCQYYYPDSPCLTHFFKLRQRVYHALCGRKR